MKKRIAFMVTALALAMTLLVTACQTGNPGAAPAADEPAAAAGDSGLSGEITYYSMWTADEAQGVAFQAVVNDFNASYVNAKVNVNFVGRDLQYTLKPALEGGAGVDMFDYPTQYVNELEPWLTDLTGTINRPFDTLGGKTIAETVIPTMLDKPKQQLNLYDIQPALGYRPWLQLFMYNADVFAEAGVSEMPATWEELDAVCAQILEATGKAPLTTDSAYSLWIPGMYLERLKGQDWVLELVNDKTGEMWSDPAVLEMAKALEAFAKKGYFDANVGTNIWPAGQTDVAMGLVAMCYNLSGVVSETAAAVAPDVTNWGGFIFPNVPGADEDRMNVAATGATMTAINNETENLAVCEEFLAFMHNAASDQHFVDNGMISSSIGGNYPPQLEALKPAFDTTSVVLQTAGGFEADADVKAILIAECVNLLAGTVTAEEFVANVQAQCDRD
jgi:raffinose/stachyose/melibiose transport system substrate-binding protein